MKTDVRGILQKITHGIRRGISAFGRLSWRVRLIAFGILGLAAVAVVLIIALTAGEYSRQASTASVPTQQTAVTENTQEPVPTTPPEPETDYTLQKGDESVYVEELQEELMVLGYLSIDDTTQYYGDATEAAVMLFQRQNGLEQNGAAGEETITCIFADDAQEYVLLEGTRGTDVDSLQRQLLALGYLDRATGYYGTDTVAAVKAFQTRNKISVDGKTGTETLDLIYSPEAIMSPGQDNSVKRRANIVEMLETAEKQLGKPYILGNEGSSSFDCSGLVYYCLRQAGSSRGRYNAAGYARVSDWEKISSMSNLEKGDLLFFWNSGRSKVGHVGIYIGGGRMIDASSSNGKVVKRSCTTSYWKKMFVYARRPW